MSMNRRTGIFPVLFFILSLTAPVAHAQTLVRSWLDWQTIETPRFSFHYPVELEAWTRRTAARSNAIDSAVRALVGYAPERKTQVVVDDPYQTANGSAWPYLDQPTIMLWASPPTPRDKIGDFRDWGEMLLTHEFAHIAHITRPTRNPRLKALYGALPVHVSPVALRLPRWVIEGYATFVEGRVTGSGRPHAAWRAALLRQWALEGQLPRYSELNASGAYEGGSFAYLAGSAFLEWLAAAHGDSSLVALWRRLSARRNRTFDEAFTGVFGESAAALYGRFSAELVGKSLEVARRVASPDTGEIIQRLERSTGDPAISADGKRVALVIRSATQPSRVVVWSTAAEPDTLKRKQDSVLLAKDPEDVPARPLYPPAKRALATLRSRGGAPYESPRFLRDGRILLWRWTTRGDGSLVSDLYSWDYDKRSVRRITRNASLRDADPLPNGRSAVASRCRGGWCGLVRVSLDDGSVTPLIDGTAEHSFFRPRVSPDGRTVLVSVHRDGRWRLATVDLATRELRYIGPETEASRYDAAWIGPNAIVATTDRGGIANLEYIDIRTLETRQLTSVTGAAVGAEPNPADGSIWFLSLYSRGYDVRRLDSTQVARGATALAATPNPRLAPALSPLPRERPSFATTNLSAPEPFGLRPRFFRWIPQPSLDADGVSGAVALISRDIIGRSELGANIAYGDAAAWRGAYVNAAWAGMRPGLRLRLFGAEQKPGSSRANIAPRSFLDTKLLGGAFDVDGSHHADAWGARYRVGVSVARAKPLSRDTAFADLPASFDPTTRALGFIEGAAAWTQRGASASLTESLGGNVTFGRSFSTEFQRLLATASLGMSGSSVIPVSVSALYGRVNRGAPVFEQFALGGGPSLLIDGSLLTQRIVMPVLPLGTSIGSSAFAYRASLNTKPLSWYFWSGSTAFDDRFRDWQRVIGAEWTIAFDAIATAGTPAARARIGIGESLDAPVRRRVRAYVSLVLNP